MVDAMEALAEKTPPELIGDICKNKYFDDRRLQAEFTG